MWWLWRDSNIYSLILSALPFTLWIFWHGYLAEKRKGEGEKWWFKPYLGEIPFRIFNTLNILTIGRWTFVHNPPLWKWAAAAPPSAPFRISLFIAVKQAVMGYFLLLIAHVLLNIPIVRNFFRLSSVPNEKDSGFIINIALLISAFYWILDSLLSSLLINNGLSFVDYLVLDIPHMNLITRIVFFLCSLIAGLITSGMYRHHRNDEKSLQIVRKEVTYREALISSLIKAIPDLIWLKDINGKFLACNSRFENFFGAREIEILGKTDYDFVDKELADSFIMNDKKTMLKGSPSTNEEVITFADGHCELLETTKTPMYNQEGELIGILGIGRDITERKQLQEQLVQSQKLESTGRLAGGVAHDFNNMLHAIIGYSEILMEELPENSPLEKYINQIMDVTTRSTRLTRQLLGFARKQSISPQKLDLNRGIEDILKILHRLLGENIELTWKPAVKLWPILMDEGQLDQIITNLCINARDSIQDVGKITIETRNLSVDEAYCFSHGDAKEQDYVVLIIGDTGCGMTKELQDHIFEPFFTTKNEKGGTGLGLATVYGIMKQNLGFINVYSEPEKGSSFKLFFPRFTGEKTIISQSQKGFSNVLAGTETVFIVEDEIFILEIIETRLKKLGYTVHGYSNPVEAVSACKDLEHIDLLITDVIMPEMNGRELNRKITTIHPEIKTIFMSGYTNDIIAHHGILQEGVSFISKPFTVKDLSIKIRSLLET